MKPTRPLSVISKCGMLFSAVCLLTATASGTSFLSITGTFGTANDVLEESFTLTSADTIDIRTWSFGGGTNVAGKVIPAGGFDPLVALFSGLPPSADIFVDSSANPFVDADNLSNPPYSRCWELPSSGFRHHRRRHRGLNLRR